MAVTLAGIFNSLAYYVGTLVIIASLAWSGFCLLSYLLRRPAPPAVPASLPVRVTPVPTPLPVAEALGASTEGAISAAIIAVIAAAVQTIVDEKHKIISIKPQDSSWEKVGRQAILSSHHIR
ncbi:MAG: hypothetical protein DVB25_05930 [Verrucomicrobia bacterium]|nr:MAG: hypothetical protein DVB25_05930 [Verrucomicrobiota bacterium]